MVPEVSQVCDVAVLHNRVSTVRVRVPVSESGVPTSSTIYLSVVLWTE